MSGLFYQLQTDGVARSRAMQDRHLFFEKPLLSLKCFTFIDSYQGLFFSFCSSGLHNPKLQEKGFFTQQHHRPLGSHLVAHFVLLGLHGEYRSTLEAKSEIFCTYNSNTDPRTNPEAAEEGPLSAKSPYCIKFGILFVFHYGIEERSVPDVQPS